MLASEYPPISGGLANYTYLISRYLSKKYNLEIILPNKKLAGFYGRIEVLKLIEKLRCAMKRKYDVVYSITFSPHLAILAKYIKARGCSLVVHGIGLDVYSNFPTFIFARKILYKISNKIICGANFQKNLILKEGCPPNKVSVVIGGVDTSKFKSIDQNIRNKYNLNNKFIILSIGRLIKRKGFDTAIKAMGYLRDVKDALLVIVGDGPEKLNLIKLTKKLSLERKVMMLGYLPDEDIPKIYSAADVLVAPFRVLGKDLEGFPLVLQESQASGTPVITTSTAGIPDLVDDGKSGYLVSPESVKEIANKILILYEDRKLLKKMSKYARKWAVERLDYKVLGKNIERILQNTLNRGEKYEKYN